MNKFCPKCGSHTDSGFSCPMGCSTGLADAPSWCPNCDKLTKEVDKLKEMLSKKPNVCSKCGFFLGLLAESECMNCEKIAAVAKVLEAAKEQEIAHRGKHHSFACEGSENGHHPCTCKPVTRLCCCDTCVAVREMEAG